MHLDSALRPATMVELARAGRVHPADHRPRRAPPVHAGATTRAASRTTSRASSTPSRCCRRPRAIERVAYEMVEDAARDGLRYLEVRYCPRLSTRGGLTMDAGARGRAARASARGERDFGVVTRVINCSLRHYAPEVSLEIARLSVAYRDRGVVAFDLAGGEAGRPPGVHQAAFDVAAEGWLGITVHAGEAAGAESIAGGGPPLPRRPHRPRHPAVRGSGAARLYSRPADAHRDQHHQQRADPRRGARGRASGARLFRCRARGDALHRRLAHDRRDAQRRVLAGPHRAGLHPRGDRPADPRRVRQRVSSRGRSGRRCWSGCGTELADACESRAGDSRRSLHDRNHQEQRHADAR